MNHNTEVRRRIEQLGERFYGAPADVALLGFEKRLRRHVLGGARTCALILITLITVFTPVTFGIAPENIALNGVVRGAVAGAIAIWLWVSLRRGDDHSGESLCILGCFGVQLITAVEVHLSGRVDHPFVLGPAFVLLAFGMFVPIRPSAFLAAAAVLACVEIVVMKSGFVRAGQLMLGLFASMTVAIGIAGAASCALRRGSLRRLYQGEHELRSRAAELAAALASLKRTQERLVTADRMATLGRMVGGVAHEVGTPLAAVRNALQEISELHSELHESVGHPEVTEQDIREIVDEGQRSLQLARDASHHAAEFIAEMKRQTRGLGRIESRPFDLAEELQRTLNLLRYRFRQQDLEVVVEVGTAVDTTVIGDAGKLSQVAANLIGNALDACADGSYEPMRVEVVAGEGELSFRVVDHGPGIRPELAKSIFDPFVTDKPVGHGTGLGLALCRDIVVGSFGGTLEHRPTPGGGATFEVTLPLEGVHVELTPPSNEFVPPGRQ